MAVSVSGAVYAAVANLKSEADGAVQLLQNQVAVAQQAADEYQSILAELVNTDAGPPAPVVAPDGPTPFTSLPDPSSPGLG